MPKGDRVTPAKDTERFPDYHPEGYDDHTALTSDPSHAITQADKNTREYHSPMGEISREQTGQGRRKMIDEMRDQLMYKSK